MIPQQPAAPGPPDSPGRPLNGKVVNLSQLQTEINAANVPTPHGIGQQGDFLFEYDNQSRPSDFPPGQRDRVDAVIAAHVPERAKLPAEYTAEWLDAATTTDRKLDILASLAGILPAEQTATPAPKFEPPLPIQIL